MDRAQVVLEDGRAFAGYSFGASDGATGEVVFNTSMTGYQEILTDPSYAGQIVVMTYPMIGNYGITPEDMESRRPFLTGLVVKEPSRMASNWRHERTLEAFLADFGIAGLWGVDTRALVRHLRDRGTMRGVIGPASTDPNDLAQRALASPSMAGLDLASTVTERRSYKWERPSWSADRNGSLSHGANTRRYHVVAIDFGIKRNILRRLVDVGARVTVVPADASARDILSLRPDGVLLSNGPGDPEPVAYAVQTVRVLLGRVPLFGICLGFQIMALACGGRTYKMKFGHRGGNHPVQDLTTGRVAITSHNHGFAVSADSLAGLDVEITHLDLNDRTVEGLRHTRHPAFGVQYHPEAAPGPRDALDLFERFATMMRDWSESNHAPA
jgi:carbamoyl-phosphate synthase small subunit